MWKMLTKKRSRRLNTNRLLEKNNGTYVVDEL